MGNPKNIIPCMFDSACWLPGKTPAYLIASFFGIIIKPEFPDSFPPLNGVYMLQQVSQYQWLYPGLALYCSFETGQGFSRINMGYAADESCFYQEYNADCWFGFTNGFFPSYWQDGFCMLSWVGPDGAMGNVIDLAKSLGIPALNKVQYEAYSDAALKQTLRFANLYDGTRVHIKRDINS